MLEDAGCVTRTRDVEYVFDWMKPHDQRRREIEAVFERRGIKTLSFRPRQNIPGLQCVDQIAWTRYQMALRELFAKTPHPLASSAWRDYSGLLGDYSWLSAVTIRKPELQRLVKHEGGR